MRSFISIAPLLASSVAGAAISNAIRATAASVNPFSGYQLYANSYYASEVTTLALPSMTGTAKAAASSVAQVPSFYWLDTAAKVPTMSTFLADIKAKNAAGASPPIAAQFVVYDLPDRDCAALASNGEYSIADGGLAKYKTYIDEIRKVLVAYSDVQTILVIEPDSLANLVTNMAVSKCANAHDAYLEGTNYAVTQLNLANVAMYLDAGRHFSNLTAHVPRELIRHAGWLGWPANLSPAAQLFAGVYNDAGQPGSLRGLATNVANYNGWSLSTCPSYTSGNSNCDEKRYINAIAPLLKSAGWDARFITDTGRNGVQPTQQNAWGDWCNVKGTGFGVRPTTSTGDSLTDAFVWVKPGGESDGTSDSSAVRYDAHCGYSDALQPAPEAGTWFQAYFAQLVQNANPSF
ncbi:uncharacterized protein N7506_001723 [Penicillium brevicompactum]|uniref:uncharacterized protein n=1 Tax=Penicillium brevicompactum TaxID=5074 RepID=UPI002540C7D3|nr:uncharacterized protein N7506_001723 [Penicillium brevicompactum]KAJ5348470.1 hypothetical protein N7506_001723 [Penicillium brevicompactum]